MEDEILFLVVSNKRNLVDVLDKHTKCLLKEHVELQDLFSNYDGDINKKFKVKRYRFLKIRKELKKLGFNDIVSCSQEKKLIDISFTKKPQKKQKYTHKQLVFKPQVETSIDELLEENYDLIHRLYLYNLDDGDMKRALKDLERYKIVQNILSQKCEKYEILNLKNTSGERFILLLGAKCAKCGSQYRLTLHHKVKPCNFNKNNILNFQVLCQRCHDGIHCDADTWYEKYMVNPFKRITEVTI